MIEDYFQLIGIGIIYGIASVVIPTILGYAIGAIYNLIRKGV